ncbi:hypothetical protein [Kordiimonas lipolytica]|nr:hypothetical protein [Kordiimonas lipolytica]
MQAIVYVLGLERMLSPRREVPLAYVMREELLPGPETVVASYVMLEMQNAAGETITVMRHVVGEKDNKLIQVWMGPKLSGPGNRLPRKDFFTFDPGAAQREAGFHRFLTEFLNLELPYVQTYEGKEVLLYLETLFPFYFVEQKRGWSATLGPFPTHLRVQDMALRAFEFVLNLDAQKWRLKRQVLEDRLEGVSRQWKHTRGEMAAIARRDIVKLEGLPVEPSAEFLLEDDFDILVPRMGEWIAIDSYQLHLMDLLEDLNAQDAPTVGEEKSALEGRLEELTNKLDEIAVDAVELHGRFSREKAEHTSIERRLSAINDDLRKNRDALKLKNFGSLIGQEGDQGQVCPTCHQGIEFELLPEQSSKAMALEENINFLDSQRSMYQSMLESSGQKFEAYQLQLSACHEDQERLRSELRSIRSTLISSSQGLSASHIRKIVTTEQELAKLASLESTLYELLEVLHDSAKEYVDVMGQLKEIPSAQFSKADLTKLAGFEESLRQKLDRFGFRSYPPHKVKISRDTFRPIVEVDTASGMVEAELNFEMSASDGIRLKWAFLLSLFEFSGTKSANHIGLLILDEPGQQEVEDLSLRALLEDAQLVTKQAGGQIIIGTSETPEQLEISSDDPSINTIHFEDYIITKVN